MLPTTRLLPPLFVLLCTGAGHGGTLDVAYPTLERMIVEGLLTEGGRYYFTGGPDDTCTYSFIQEPRVSSSEGRLDVRFLFAGSIGAELGGRCAGRGGNFDIVMSGVPSYENGTLFLDDLRLQAENPVFELFSVLVESHLREKLRIQLRSLLETHLGRLTTAGRVSVEELAVSEIQVGAESVTLTVDLGVGVHP